ncbi:MAG: hypothetical protein ACYDGR_09530 [Candidatus Dormibacteria bacterium]
MTIDGNTVLGAATLREQGFLHAVQSTDDHATIAALSPKLWRINNDSRYDLAKSFGAKVTWVVGDSCNPDAIIFIGQAAWEACIVNLVQTHSPTSARPVDYWDVWGEPDHDGVFTSSQILTIFQLAHNDIRSVDPRAQIVGPDLASYDDSGTCNKIDMKCFLSFVNTNRLEFDVLAWNEIIDRSGNQITPPQVATHFSSARALVASMPGLVNPTPKYFVEEYSDSRNFTVPGWTVAWLKAFEDNNSDGATRACWDTQDSAGGATYSGCNAGLNGLLQSDGISKRALYWVHDSYAAYTGNRVSSTGSSTDTVGYGSRKDSTRELTALVGRWSVGTVNPVANVTTTFKVPSSYGLSSMHYTIYRIPNQLYAVNPVLYSSGTVPVSGGQAVLTVSSMADGDAYTFDLFP